MFSTIIEVLIFASVGIAILKTYLTANKVWSRKSDVNVANSISVYAAILGLLAGLPFFVKYAFIDLDYQSAANAMIGLILGTFFLLVGSGLWVKNRNKNISFWSKFKRAIKLENDEVADLVKAFILPKGANLIVQILQQMALIDRKIDDKEVNFIRVFAKSWNLDFEMNEIKKDDSQDSNYINLRASVISYLDISPPIEQAAQLRDVINSLANIDNKLSEEEVYILEEIDGLIDNYVEQGSAITQFEVVIAPQSDEQKIAIKKLIPNFTLSENKGGVGYIEGIYYSEKMAQMICNKFRSLNLFTVIVKIEPKTSLE